MGSDTYHEPYEELREETRLMHRAIVSLMEELEAIDWYQQRADATNDAELREILIHNKNEEIEHAMMTLEWIRRKSPEFDEEMRKYLFTEAPILEVEGTVTGNGAAPVARERAEASVGGSLGVGSLR